MSNFNHAACTFACALRRKMGATTVWVSFDHTIAVIDGEAIRFQNSAKTRRQLSGGTPELGEDKLLAIQPSDEDDNPEILNTNICRDGSACSDTHGFGHYAGDRS